MRPKPQLVLKDSALTKPDGLCEFVTELKKSDSVSGYHYIPAREPQLVDFPAALDSRLRNALGRRSITKLYSHQAVSFDLARSGKNIVIVTPTASGKTLCYNLPVLQPESSARWTTRARSPRCTKKRSTFIKAANTMCASSISRSGARMYSTWIRIISPTRSPIRK